jgi:hypothetical protein
MERNQDPRVLGLGGLCAQCRSMSSQLLSVTKFYYKYRKVTSGSNAGCPSCGILNSVAIRARGRERLESSGIILCQTIYLSNRRYHRHNVGEDGQGEGAGVRKDEDQGLKGLAALSISKPKVRGIRLCYVENEGAPDWSYDEIGWLESFALEGISLRSLASFSNDS